MKEICLELKREFNVVDNAKVIIMGIGDATTHILNQVRISQNEMYKDNLKYSFISTSIMAINNTLGKIFFPKSLKTNYYNNIDYLEIGRNITKGLGANSNPEKALKAFNESEKEIDEFLNKKLEKMELVVIIAALGGGTGTTITPLINQKIKNMNIPVINIVSLPMKWEGDKRNLIAKEHISDFYKTADKVITIDNDELFNSVKKITNGNISIMKVFQILDSEYAKIIEMIYESLLYEEVINKITKEKYLEIIKDKSIKLRYKNEFFIDLNKDKLDVQISNYLENKNKENIKFLIVKIKGNKNLFNLYQIIEYLNKLIDKNTVISGYIEQDNSITSKISISFIIGEV